MIKLRSLCKAHFPLRILFGLTLAFDRKVLYENVVFFIIVLSTKKLYSGFPKKKFVFQTTFKHSRHMFKEKYSNLLNGGQF